MGNLLVASGSYLETHINLSFKSGNIVFGPAVSLRSNVKVNSAHLLVIEVI